MSEVASTGQSRGGRVMQLSELREYVGENLGGRNSAADYTKITKDNTKR